MALYIPHSIFHLARLLYVRPENFGPYYAQYNKRNFCLQRVSAKNAPSSINPIFGRNMLQANASRRPMCLYIYDGPGQLSRYSDSLRAGRSGDRMPVRGEIFHTRPDRSWGPPSLLYNAYRIFPGGKAAGA